MRLLLLTTPLRNQTGVENYAFYMEIFSLHVIEKLVAHRNTVNILCACVHRGEIWVSILGLHSQKAITGWCNNCI